MVIFLDAWFSAYLCLAALLPFFPSCLLTFCKTTSIMHFLAVPRYLYAACFSRRAHEKPFECLSCGCNKRLLAGPHISIMWRGATFSRRWWRSLAKNMIDLLRLAPDNTHQAFAIFVARGIRETSYYTFHLAHRYTAFIFHENGAKSFVM